MRVLSVVLVLMLCVCRGEAGVQVKAGHMTFPLEAVKQLKALMDLDDNVSPPHLSETSIMAVCADPLLPQIFAPVCHGREAGVVLSQLVYIITPLDLCEICANPSCFGCLI